MQRSLDPNWNRGSLQVVGRYANPKWVGLRKKTKIVLFFVFQSLPASKIDLHRLWMSEQYWNWRWKIKGNEVYESRVAKKMKNAWVAVMLNSTHKNVGLGLKSTPNYASKGISKQPMIYIGYSLEFPFILWFQVNRNTDWLIKVQPAKSSNWLKRD